MKSTCDPCDKFAEGRALEVFDDVKFDGAGSWCEQKDVDTY